MVRAMWIYLNDLVVRHKFRFRHGALQLQSLQKNPSSDQLLAMK